MRHWKAGIRHILASYCSHRPQRQPCLWLLPTPWVNANGPFFAFFPQDLKSLVREYDGLSSRTCTCHSSQARGRQGNWLQKWALWYITSASLQGPIPHPPAAGDVACWCLTDDSLPRNHHPLGGNASPKGTPSTRGSLYPMPVDTRTQKSGPCASIWDISEGPSQTQSSLWRWLTCLRKHGSTSSCFPLSLTDIVPKSASRWTTHRQINVCLRICLQSMMAALTFPERTALNSRVCGKYDRPWILGNQRKWHTPTMSHTFPC